VQLKIFWDEIGQLQGEIMAVRTDSPAGTAQIRIEARFWQNKAFPIIKVGGTYSYHSV
jgi:hypothetical protein